MIRNPLFAKRTAALGMALALGLGAAGCSKAEDTATTSGGTTSAVATGGSTVGTAKPHTDASAEELEKYQALLDAVGCWAGAVDGKLGKETEAAIKAFQAAEKLTVDGLLGPITEKKLQDAGAAGKAVCSASGSTTSTHSGGGSTSTTKPSGSTSTTSGGGSTSTTKPAGSTTSTGGTGTTSGTNA